MASVVPQAERRLLITVNRVGISGSPVSFHWNHQTGRDESLITAPMWPPLTLGGSSLHMPGCWWRFWPSTKPPLTQTQGGGGHLIIARWEWKFRLPWSPLTPWVGTAYSLEMKVPTPYLTFSDTSLVLGRRIWNLSMAWWEWRSRSHFSLYRCGCGKATISSVVCVWSWVIVVLKFSVLLGWLFPELLARERSPWFYIYIYICLL